MSDLVERLLSPSYWKSSDGYGEAFDRAPFDAADEIERLQTENARLHSLAKANNNLARHADELERLSTPTDVVDRREAVIEAIAQIEMDREGYPLSRTQQEIYDDAAETFDAIASLIAGPLPEGYMLVKRKHIEAAAREFSLFAPGNPATAILQALVRPTGES